MMSPPILRIKHLNIQPQPEPLHSNDYILIRVWRVYDFGGMVLLLYPFCFYHITAQYNEREPKCGDGSVKNRIARAVLSALGAVPHFLTE